MVVRYYEGKRLYLRPLELADEPQLRTWLNDPENWRTLLRFLPINAEREREYLEELYKSSEHVGLGIVLRRDDRLIGATGFRQIHPSNRSAVFGLLIGDRREQSRGYGTEVTRLMVRYGFEELNLNRMALTVFSHNGRAIRAYRRAGFVQEGCLRQAMFRNGRYHDELCFSILRSEWELAGEDEASERREDPDVAAPEGVHLASMTTWDTRVTA